LGKKGDRKVVRCKEKHGVCGFGRGGEADKKVKIDWVMLIASAARRRKATNPFEHEGIFLFQKRSQRREWERA